jgi:hypothetical protein
LAILGVQLEEDPHHQLLGVELQRTAIAFLLHALNPENGRMRNFLSFNRTWLEDAGSEDSHGRALWALGLMADSSSDLGVRSVSKELFLSAIPPVWDFTSVRGYAFTILGLVELLASEYSRECLHLLDDLAERLNYAYLKSSDSSWHWFEPELTYDNARLPQALLTAGHLLGNESMVGNAKEALDWLVRMQTDRSGCFLPIGSNGFFPRTGARARYDQQPLEAAATIGACEEALRITGDKCWRLEMLRAFNWFHGANTELKSLIDEATGGCCDGLLPGAVNLNQGAESSLAYLSSTLTVTKVELESAKSHSNGFLA